MPTTIPGLEALYVAMLNHDARVVRYYDSEDCLELELNIWETREYFALENYDERLPGARKPFVVTLYKDED